MQGEANVTALRIEFDEGWDSFAKTVTFWNARGENPVKRILTADLLEDITKSTRIYLCPIPGEPLELAGECTFVIDGAADGKRPRSLPAELKVRPAPYADNAGEPVDPTPTQAEQLQGQIDTLLGDMQEQAVIATYAAAAAEESAENAKKSEDSARESAKEAADAASAREAIENMVVTGENVPADSDTPVVEKSMTEDGYVHLHFNTRQGVSGVYVGDGEMPEGYDVQVDYESGDDVLDIYGLAEAAEQAAKEAAEVAVKTPYISEDKRWMVWDETTGAYVDSGVSAVVVGDYISGFSIDDSGHLVVNYTDGTIADLGKVEGKDGVDGKNGTDGANGADGKDGASAYEEAQAGGYTGTEAEYQAMLAGIGSHAARHKAGGADPLTAEDVGARPNTWTPTPSDIGAAPMYTYSTEDVAAGSASPYETGHLHFVYEA